MTREVTSLRKAFEERASVLITKEVPAVIQECKMTALLELFKSHEMFLEEVVAEVVDFNGNHLGFDVIRRVGWCRDFVRDSVLYYCLDGEFYEEKSRAKPPRVARVGSDKFQDNATLFFTLPELLNRAFLRKKVYTDIEMPPGFFVFKFTARWTAGGYEDDPVRKMEIIKVENIEMAWEALKNRLSGMRENFFYDFMVCTNQGWLSIKTDPTSFSTFRLKAAKILIQDEGADNANDQ